MDQWNSGSVVRKRGEFRQFSGIFRQFQVFSGLSVGTFVCGEAPSMGGYGSKEETGLPGLDINSLGGRMHGWSRGWSGWMGGWTKKWAVKWA